MIIIHITVFTLVSIWIFVLWGLGYLLILDKVCKIMSKENVDCRSNTLKEFTRLRLFFIWPYFYFYRGVKDE